MNTPSEEEQRAYWREQKRAQEQVAGAMSDKPTGEWTVERVYEIMGTDYGADGWERERKVADAHNAALREERARFHGDDYADMDAARNRILDLEQQLAAVRKALCSGGGLREATDIIDDALAKVKQ